MTRTFSKDDFHPCRQEKLTPVSLQERSEGSRSLHFNTLYCMWLSLYEEMAAVLLPVWTTEDSCGQGKERTDKGYSKIQGCPLQYPLCSQHTWKHHWVSSALGYCNDKWLVKSHSSTIAPACSTWCLVLIYERGRRSCQEQRSSHHLCCTFMSIAIAFLQTEGSA